MTSDVNWKPGGRWMVVTGVLASRHHSLSAARKDIRRNAGLRPVLRRYRRKEWDLLLRIWHGR